MKRLALFLLLGGLAQAEINVVSVYPNEVTLRCGGRDTSASSMQPVTVEGTEITVLDEKGTQIYQGPLSKDRFYVIGPGPDGRAVLTDAGATQTGGQEPVKACGFFNGAGYPVGMEMYAISGDETLSGVKVGNNALSPLYEMPAVTMKVFVKDEIGNPIGTSYTNVKHGNYYLIYRRRPTLFDLVKLGQILPKLK
ncbi:MAG: hypothetical protein KF760_26130 [Candidatus Eremiobacteraeota bacterium]|nr:hypothetical protein [Candidatus Eremiobacteraeota bacterium]MCW5869681.1 hypothetical protein [Candidatus Eremiobacteraeota bacterium]